MILSIPTVLLNDQRAIPAIAYGTGSVMKGMDVKAYVVQAIEGGFTHVDTAQYYGNEESVGKALREVFGKATRAYVDEKIDIEGQTSGNLRRENVWVTTKYSGGGNAEAALDTSLAKLGLSSVDLYLIHTPRIAPDILKTWSELEDAHSQGKAKSIGVSNFNVDQLKLVIEHGRYVPSVNQIEFHPYNYHENIELLEFSKRFGIVTESYSGLTPITKLPGGKLDGVLENIAKKLGPQVTPAQVIMSWIRAKGVVIVTTTTRKERVHEYLSVFDLPNLTEKDVAAIDEAGKYPPIKKLQSYIPSNVQAQKLAAVTVVLVTTALLYRFISSCY